jgi:hypothetical protein
LLHVGGMPEPDQDKPKQEQRARSPKPGAGAPDKTNPPDPIRDEAERLKSSTSADRSKRTHKQSTKRREKD